MKKITVAFVATALATSITQAAPVVTGDNALLERSNEASTLDARGGGFDLLTKNPIDASANALTEMNTPLLDTSDSGLLTEHNLDELTAPTSRLGSSLEDNPTRQKTMASSSGKSISSDNFPLQLTDQSARAQAEIAARKELRTAVQRVTDAEASVRQLIELEQEALRELNTLRELPSPVEPIKRAFQEIAVEKADRRHQVTRENVRRARDFVGEMDRQLQYVEWRQRPEHSAHS